MNFTERCRSGLTGRSRKPLWYLYHREFESLPLRKMFYAYILKSLKDNTYYYGSTADIKSRLKTHNSGNVKYTKGHRPWKLHYSEMFETRSEAMKREKFFKSIDGYIWLKKRNII